MLKKKQALPVVIAMILVSLLVTLPALQVRRDWAFVDKHTGSHKGHIKWIFGIESHSWYTESALEAYMRSHHPKELQYNWVSYAGTGRGIFGNAVLYGHGRPGPIMLLPPEMIKRYFEIASPEEKRQVYDLLVADDRDRIREGIDRIFERLYLLRI